MTIQKLLRLGLTIGLAATLTVACGSDDTSDDTASDSASATETAASGSDSGSASGSGSGSASASEPADTDGAGEETEDTEDTQDTEDTEDTEDTGDAATRTVQSAYGPVDVPVDPQRVFALDEYAGAAMLYSGLEPVAVFAPFRARIPLSVLQDRGVEVTEIVFGEWNIEQIAAVDPDMIVMTDVGDPNLIENLGGIAPTVVLPFVAPWADIVAAVGDAAGTPEVATTITDELTARLAELQAESADQTFSILATGPQFGTFSLGVGGVGSSILEQAGYLRPEAQLAPPDLGVSLSLSPENLGDHDGDFVLQLGGDESFYSIADLEALPTFQAIPAVQDGRTAVGLGEIWTSSDPFSTYWMVEDLRAIRDGEPLGTIDDVDARWNDFVALAGG